MKCGCKAFRYWFLLIFLGILARLIFAYIFKGHSDPWNLESYSEYLIDGQMPTGIPYLPSIYVFGYIFEMLVNNIGLFYSFWLRLADIFADIGIACLLFKIAKQLGRSDRFSLFVCAAYVFNPISFEITAFHGQFDQFVFLLILSAVYVELAHPYPEKYKTAAISLLLVLATYFKPYAILYFPAFFFKRNGIEDKKKFTFMYVLGCILPFILLLDPLIIYNSLRAVIFYVGGNHLGWGIFFSGAYTKFSKPVTISCLFIIGYIGRKKDILPLLFINTLIIYVLSPGLASQYLYWIIPIGVMFIDWYFCLYSIAGFLWQLNFFQYLIVKENFYGNYSQFVPLASLQVLYNYWLYPEQLVKFFHFMIGGIAIPVLIILWLITAVKKFNFLSDSGGLMRFWRC